MMEEKINFVKWLGQKKSLFLKEGLFAIIFFVTFALYHLPLAAIFYPMLLCFVTGMLFLVWDYKKFAVRHERLQQLSAMPFDVMTDFPESVSVLETDYQQIIVQLQEGQRRMKDEMSFQYQDMMDYYTVWAHQIKTPIAAAKLIIQSLDDVVRNLENNSLGNSYNESYDEHYDDFKNNESNEKNDDNDLEKLDRKLNELSHEMFRIEFYTDAVMDYLRLEDISSDYEFKLCRLDTAVKKAVKKFAPQFIGRHISLHIEQIEDSVCTDSKWLGFIIEQLISNAVKYSKDGGSVRIYTLHGSDGIKKNSKDDSLQLVIEDTGIGISEEDIPRIMERGFTGYNGRLDKKSSGIGLYLCRKAADRLGFVITYDASYKNGTRVLLDMTQRYTKHE